MNHGANDILCAVDANGVATITLNKPRKRNALALSMWRDLGNIFSDLEKQDSVRVIILTGAGGNFCAGADISEFPQVRSTVEDGHRYEAATEAAVRAIRDCAKPTIAAVSGFGVGGGCGVALACDIRIGDPTTRMGIPAAKLGIVYGTLDCELLMRQVGLAKAKLVLFSGRYFPAEQCQEMGLTDLISNEPSLVTAKSLADELAANAPLSLRGAKIVLDAVAQGTAASQAKEKEIAAVIDAALESADYREAGRAFLEKRKPTFTGK